MKRISLVPALVIAAGILLQGLAYAGPFDDIFGAVLKEVAKNTDSSRNNSETAPQQDVSCLRGGGGGLGARVIAHPTVSDIQEADFSKTPTIEAYCQGFRNANPQDARCYKECESQFRDDFTVAKSRNEQSEKIAAQNEELRKSVQQEEARKAAYEKQQAAALESNLRSGKVKPENINQAMTAFDAADGTGLASAPKIRPDGKMYAFYGIVEQAGAKPEFIAYTSRGQDDHMRALLLGGTRNKTNYFKVKIPKEMQAAYFDNAKIGGGFDLVGRYVENMSYKTVAGQEKSAPVFEAVYFVMW